MKINLLGQDYLIKFAHDTNDLRATTATIYEIGPKDATGIPTKIHIYTTTALCSDKDNFDKSIGRKISLTRLLKWMSTNRFQLTKVGRGQIWESYFKECRR
jgi:hypothetical protein